MTDLSLAIAHHLLMFTVLGILFGEFIAVRSGMSAAAVRQVAWLDLVYGVSAGLIVIIGFSRALFAAKGWDYYAVNAFFWAKLAVFAVIGAISIRPTILFIRWRRAGVAPDSAAVAEVRRLLYLELGLFALLPAFAAAMARGYGEF